MKVVYAQTLSEGSTEQPLMQSPEKVFESLLIFCCGVIFGAQKYDGPQGTCCKQKTIAANKKDALLTKNDRCKQKMIAANKKDALQTKNDCCKQKRCAANKKRCGYMAGNRSRFSKYRHSGIFNKFHQSINPS